MELVVAESNKDAGTKMLSYNNEEVRASWLALKEPAGFATGSTFRLLRG